MVEIIIAIVVIVVFGVLLLNRSKPKVENKEVKAAVHEAVCAPVVETKVEAEKPVAKAPAKKAPAKKTVAKKPAAKKPVAKKQVKK
jgi:hypothetical protein